MPRTKIKAAKVNHHNGVNSMKTHLRDLRRMLAHAKDMPADIRIGHEREVATYEQDLATAVHEAQLSNTIKKYHMVRFFGELLSCIARGRAASCVRVPPKFRLIPSEKPVERQKATRFLAQAQRHFQQATDDEGTRPLLEKELYNRNVDLNYTVYFPLKQAYSSLYKDARETPGSVNRSHPVWKAVADTAGFPRFLRELRDGPVLGPERVDIENKITRYIGAKRSKDQNALSNQTKVRKPGHDQMDGENGEGFFET